MNDDRSTATDAVGTQAQHEQVKQSMNRVVRNVTAEPHGLDTLVRNYWPVIGALVAVAVAWGASTMQIANVGANLDKVLAKLDNVSDQVSGIKATATYSEREVTDLRDRVWKLEAKR